MDEAAIPNSGGWERRPKRPAQYTPQACNFCQKRHIKCDSQNPCFQCSRRGIKCDYKQQTMKRGPKPGASRDAKPRASSSQVNRLIAEVEKQKQLAEYWRRNYLQLQQIAQDQGISLPHLVSATSSKTDWFVEAAEATTTDNTTARSPIAFDAVAAFMQCMHLAIPNNWKFNQDKTYEWWLLLSSGELPAQLTTEKLVEGFGHACVFAHGCRLRGSEDRAQYFGDRAESLLRSIMASAPNLVETADIANGLISSILLHISFQGALPNAEVIQNALNNAHSIVQMFASARQLSALDAVMVQRVYAQLVGIQQTSDDRWKYLNIALAAETPCDEDDLQRRAFLLSNMAILALVLSNSVNWFDLSSQDDTEPRKQHIKSVLSYLDEVESKLTRFEIRSRPEGPRYYSESLIAGYRVILYSTRASIFTLTQNENDSMMWFAKTIEVAKLLRESVQVPLLATALSLLYAIRLLQQMNQPTLLADGMSVLERVIKYYPALYMPWKVLSGQMSSVLGPGGPFGAISHRLDSSTPWLEDTHAVSTAALLGIGLGDDDMDDDYYSDDDDIGEEPYVPEVIPPPKRAKRAQTPPQSAPAKVSPAGGRGRGSVPPAQSDSMPSVPLLPPGSQAQFAQYQQAAAAAMMRYYPTNPVVYGFNPAVMAAAMAAANGGGNAQGPQPTPEMAQMFARGPPMFAGPGGPPGMFLPPQFHPGVPVPHPTPASSSPSLHLLNSANGSSTHSSS